MFNHVLVTGGAGFIGSHTVDLLIERGYRVRVFDNLEPQVHGPGRTPPAYLNPEAEFILGDVLDRDALRRALEGIDAVIHDAAMVGVGQSQYEIHRYTRTNTLGTANLLDIIVNEKTGVQRLLVASSMSIYGEGAYRRPGDGSLAFPTLRPDSQLARHDFEMRDPETGEALEPVATAESKPLHCTSIYALGKRDQEEYTLVAARAHKLSAVACRFFNVYGPRQSLSNPYTGAAAIFLSRLKNGHPALIYEDGEQMRDFIHVRDIAGAKVHLLECEGATNAAYNICTGRPTSIIGLARLLAKSVGREDLQPQVLRRFRSGDIRHCFGDGRSLAALGWKARIALSDGLQELIEWSASQDSVDRVEQAHAELESRGLVAE